MKKQTKFTERVIRHSVLVLNLLTGVILFAIGQNLQAQIIPAKPQVKATPQAAKILIVKGKGIDSPQSGVENLRQLPAAPASLPPAEKRNLITQALSENQVSLPVRSITPYVTLSPRATFVADKGSMSFYYAKSIITLNNVASFQYKAYYDFVGVSFEIAPSRPGQWLYVDCFVYALNKDPFFLRGYSGWWEQQPSEGHLQFIFVSESANWYEFRISHSNKWWIYSCEVNAIE